MERPPCGWTRGYSLWARNLDFRTTKKWVSFNRSHKVGVTGGVVLQ